MGERPLYPPSPCPTCGRLHWQDEPLVRDLTAYAERMKARAGAAEAKLADVRDLAKRHATAGLGSASDYDKGLSRMAREVLGVTERVEANLDR